MIVFISVEANDQKTLAFAQIFKDIPSTSDTSGRSKKLAQAMALHQQQKPSVWSTDLATLGNLPVLAKLHNVQEIVNKHITYRDDPDNVWKSPYEAYRNGGDCEDYAIAKLILLKESGFPEDNLRLTTLAPDATHQVYHVVLLAKWQDQVYVLDSPNRTINGRVVLLQDYPDAARTVVWAGWPGGFSSSGLPLADRMPDREKILGVDGPSYGPRRMPSYRQFPAREKLVRIAADLLIIHPWEPKLTPAEIERLRILRIYFYDPTPDNGQNLTPFEIRKLDELRRSSYRFDYRSVVFRKGAAFQER